MTCFALFSAACGGGETMPPPEIDAGVAGRLEILVPPGESIPLAFGADDELRVRYSHVGGDPIAGAEIAFAIVADPARQESAGGSSLSSPVATTDEGGIARVTLDAAAARVNFRVEATAQAASVATFYVSVSNEGFAELIVTPRHDGTAPVAIVELRLYGSEHSCADLDPSAPPASSYPPRSLNAFDIAAHFAALSAGESYSILGWGRTEEGNVVAAGCLDITPETIRPSAMLRVDLHIVDRGVGAGPLYALSSFVDLTAAGDMLLSSGAWGLAACPHGSAQLVLDAALAELGPGPVASAIEMQRGIGDDCRGSFALDGSYAIEFMASDPATLPDMFAWAAVLYDQTTMLRLTSRLAVDSWTATHTLGWATLGAVTFWSVDLAETTLPVITASAAWDDFMIAPHGFTLRLGTLLRASFAAEIGEPAGALASSTVDCASLSMIACVAASQPVDCLTAACAAVLPALDLALAQPFERLDASSLDFTLAGACTPTDDDGDLVADTLDGMWTGTILVDGTPVVVSGGFEGTAVP